MRGASVCVATLALVAGCGSSTANSADGRDGDGGGGGQHFSFFVTSLRALQELSEKEIGFGGDLRFGETGPGSGLHGADKICAAIAERSLAGASAKQWRAFLSAVDDGAGSPVHAIDRIGAGPWYDRQGRLFAPSLASLLNTRPQGGDPAIVNDFPNEDGIGNHAPDGTGQVDNHDMLTGTNDRGQLYGLTSTCLDWTSATGDITREGRPRVGHSWPRGDLAPNADGGIVFPCDPSAGLDCDGGFGPPGDGGFGPPFGDGGFPPIGDGGFAPPGIADSGVGGPGGIEGVNSWMSSLDESGCAAGVNLVETGGPQETSNTVGSGGGYGGFYCFALIP